ncbi:MAG: hypothetical protein R6X32_17130 [Chloroflexota bacterium]
MAQQLKEAGLVWEAQTHDFFAIPERGMDEQIFVVTDVMAYLELLKGWPVVTFHGTAEWALDYILTAEVLWLPTESQIRDQLAGALLGEAELKLSLTLQHPTYLCEILYRGQPHQFSGATASEAYGLALLHILDRHNNSYV